MHDAKELTVAYIGGGSRGWAWGFMTDLAMDPDLCGTVRLYDIDREAAERNRIIGGKISSHPKAVSRWAYEVSATLEEALAGADFVVISILPGTFDEMESDVHLPERVGIYQPVGDTIGAGGFMRAMRTVPMFVTIAEAIRDAAPDAWVINYTNPMSLCVRTLYEVLRFSAPRSCSAPCWKKRRAFRASAGRTCALRSPASITSPGSPPPLMAAWI